MAKFNKRTATVARRSAIVSPRRPAGFTHEGAPGFARDARSELFLLAVATMVGENTFYENAADRDVCRCERRLAASGVGDRGPDLGQETHAAPDDEVVEQAEDEQDQCEHVRTGLHRDSPTLRRGILPWRLATAM